MREEGWHILRFASVARPLVSPSSCSHQFGLLLLLGNGTYVNMASASSIFQVKFQQSTICNCELMIGGGRAMRQHQVKSDERCNRMWI